MVGLQFLIDILIDFLIDVLSLAPHPPAVEAGAPGREPE
jgi:hypothetical protein